MGPRVSWSLLARTLFTLFLGHSGLFRETKCVGKFLERRCMRVMMCRSLCQIPRRILQRWNMHPPPADDNFDE